MKMSLNQVISEFFTPDCAGLGFFCDEVAYDNNFEYNREDVLAWIG